MTADRLLRWFAAAFLLIFGFLPIVNWIPGGHEAPWYGERVREWLVDGTLVLGVGVLLAIVSRRVPGLWRPGWFGPIAAAAHARPARTAVLLGVGAFALYAVIAQVVFSAKPLLIDEIIQVWQARVLASGRLWVPTPEFPEFTSAMHLVDHEGRRFGQFPMGGPAMLALGSLVRLEWLVGPAFGAASAMLAWGLFRRIEARLGVALGAALLFALAPFTAFMAGSHMNHVTTLTWLLVAMLGLARATGSATPRWSDGLLCGLGLGVAATIRPVDALAFALPAAAWLAWHAWHTRRPAAFLASGVGVAVPVALLLMANAATTGDPLTMGYQVMWGPEVGLGFRQTGSGMAHSPLAGVELISLYILRLQLHLLEAPIPALLPAAVALVLARRVAGFDSYLLVSSGLVVGLYSMYWHDGFFLGPRFMYPLVPALALWTARVPGHLCSRLPGPSYRTAAFAMVACVPLVLINVTVIRGQQYSNELQTMRFDADKGAMQQGITDALVFVRESWGSELMVRMWALGVTRPQAEFLYPRIDACRLELSITKLERRGSGGAAAFEVLQALTADSARLVPSGFSADRSLRVQPGWDYPAECLDRIALEVEGFTLFAPFLLATRSGNTFVRDLGSRNQYLLEVTPQQPLYLLLPEDHQGGSRLEFHPVGPIGSQLTPAWGDRTDSGTPSLQDSAPGH